MLKGQKIPLPNEPQKSCGFVQKQPPQMFCKRRCSKKFAHFTGKHLCQSLFLIKLQAQVCKFIKKKLQHQCFPVKLPKFLRISYFKNICERLVLFVSPQNTIANCTGEFGLDETLKECKVSIFLSTTILFVKMQSYHL